MSTVWILNPHWLLRAACLDAQELAIYGIFQANKSLPIYTYLLNIYYE